jgi:hypothetical protein
MFTNIFYDAQHSKIYLWEIINGKKLKGVYNIEYDYYIEDPSGNSEVKDIMGRPMIAQVASSRKAITELKSSGVYTCEGDLSEEVKFLQKRYGKIKNMLPDSPLLNVCFLDIEVATGASGFSKNHKIKVRKKSL